MALADLGNVEFALALLGLVWPTDREFPSNAAMRVIDKALLSDSRSLQVDAAIELKANALRLVDGGASSMSWPSSWTHQWHSEAHRSVRELMLDTVAIVVEDLLQQENVDEGLLLSLFVELSYALDQDDDVRIKAMAALTLRALGPNFAPWETVFGTLGDVNPAEVVERAEAAIAVARDSGQIAEGSEASAARIAALVQASVSSSLPAEDQGAGSG
jgi:hypothetical protein